MSPSRFGPKTSEKGFQNARSLRNFSCMRLTARVQALLKLWEMCATSSTTSLITEPGSLDSPFVF